MWIASARHQHRHGRYATDVTDAEFALIEPLAAASEAWWPATADAVARGAERFVVPAAHRLPVADVATRVPAAEHVQPQGGVAMCAAARERSWLDIVERPRDAEGSGQARWRSSVRPPGPVATEGLKDARRLIDTTAAVACLAISSCSSADWLAADRHSRISVVHHLGSSSR
jgi:hypothetical protein